MYFFCGFNHSFIHLLVYFAGAGHLPHKMASSLGAEATVFSTVLYLGLSAVQAQSRCFIPIVA